MKWRSEQKVKVGFCFLAFSDLSIGGLSQGEGKNNSLGGAILHQVVRGQTRKGGRRTGEGEKNTRNLRISKSIKRLFVGKLGGQSRLEEIGGETRGTISGGIKLGGVLQSRPVLGLSDLAEVGEMFKRDLGKEGD